MTPVDASSRASWAYLGRSFGNSLKWTIGSAIPRPALAKPIFFWYSTVPLTLSHMSTLRIATAGASASCAPSFGPVIWPSCSFARTRNAPCSAPRPDGLLRTSGAPANEATRPNDHASSAACEPTLKTPVSVVAVTRSSPGPEPPKGTGTESMTDSAEASSAHACASGDLSVLFVQLTYLSSPRSDAAVAFGSGLHASHMSSPTV